MTTSSIARASYTVAIVEDEPVLREEMAFQLRHLGFQVMSFESAAQFYRHLAVASTTIAVLDIGLPAEDGLSICQHLRDHDNQMGIVFVTARGHREDRLSGLSAGADAYLTKPIDMDELVLILDRLALRCTSRTQAASTGPAETRAGAWRLDVAAGLLVARSGVSVRVTANESVFLQKLMHKAGATCTPVELAAAIGIYPDDLDKHRVEVIVSRLRAKVERSTGVPLPLRAVRGVGYCWGESVEALAER